MQTHKKYAIRIGAGVALMLLANLCQAQYVWIDSKGMRQVSGIAPPASVPLNKILKAPGMAARTLDMHIDAAPAADAPKAPPKAAPTLAERDADYRKRALETAAQQKKVSDEASDKQAKSEYCAAAAANRNDLNSGRRIAVTNKNGETEIMDDGARALAVARANTNLSSCR